MHLNKIILIAFTTVLVLSCNQEEKQIPPSFSDSTVIAHPDSIPEVENNPYYASPDRSPMDMVYFPLDYPKLKMANGKLAARPIVRVIYSRPHLSRRSFDDIIAYNTPWRLGANESTEIEFYRNVTIDGKKIPQGRYILYCVPQENEWTIVLNNNTDTWGLQPDSTQDIHRVKVPVAHDHPRLEFFTISFEATSNGTSLIMAWDDVVAKLPISW